MMISSICTPSLAANQNLLNNNPYEYGVIVGDSQWETMTTQERMSCFNIPIPIANGLTTQALLISVLRNPYMINIFAYDSIDLGIECTREQFPSFDVLLKREDVVAVLSEFIDDYYSVRNEYGLNEVSYYVAVQIKQYLLQHQVIDFVIDPETGVLVLFVQTPNNSDVMVQVDRTWETHRTTEQGAYQIADSYFELYDIVEIEDISPSYNCHTYAWYSIYNRNYWMPNPFRYMLDGSYTQITTPVAGCKVTYKQNGTIKHSGIVISVSNGAVYVRSKWGSLGLYEHEVHDSCYPNENIQDWR